MAKNSNNKETSTKIDESNKPKPIKKLKIFNQNIYNVNILLTTGQSIIVPSNGHITDIEENQIDIKTLPKNVVVI